MKLLHTLLLMLPLACSDGGPDVDEDSGRPDGGSADGGSADGAATDGGAADGGASDGGTADGGTADGGTADGGTADGGTIGPERAWEWGTINTAGDADASLVGENEGDWAGGGLSAPGDATGDGIDDLVITAAYVSEGADAGGKVYLVAGRSSGWSIGEPLAPYPAIIGDQTDQQLYEAVEVGDIDGDGLADVGLVGGATNGGPPYDGIVVLSDGDAWLKSRLASEADLVVDGDGTVDHQIRSRVGDLDGDGIDDLMTFQANDSVRTATLSSGTGSSGTRVLPDDAFAWFDVSLEDPRFIGGADLDGDGLGDLVFQAHTPRGAGLVVFGADMPPPGTVVTGPKATELVAAEGSTLLPLVLPDIDADGDDELVVWQTGGDDDGLWICLGRPTWPDSVHTDDCEVTLLDGRQGTATAVGDLTCDGLPDVLVRTSNDFAIVAGQTDWTTGDAPETVARLTRSDGDLPDAPTLDQLGDVDGDGCDDLVLADKDAGSLGPDDAGRAWVFRGSSSWPKPLDLEDADLILAGDVDSQLLGDRLVLTDLNGDGLDDIVTSSFVAHPIDDPAGETFIFFGQTAR